MQRLLISICLLLLSGCSVYKIDIQQGNALPDEKLAQLKVGMDRDQVQFLLGSPSLADPFHPDRWDYLFSLRRNDELMEDTHIVLHFEGEKLKQIEERKRFKAAPAE